MDDFERFNAALSYDPETGDFLWKIRPSNQTFPGDDAGGVNKEGYRKIRFQRKAYAAHRIAFLLMTGKWPSLQIDHINGIKNDNRWKNLREVSCRENQLNQKSHRKGKLHGVTFNKQFQNWRAQIKIDGKTTHLGIFETAYEAHTCYVRAYYAACEIDELNQGKLHV